MLLKKIQNSSVYMVWFYAFIISIMGVMLALASFVIRDSENFKPENLSLYLIP